MGNHNEVNEQKLLHKKLQAKKQEGRLIQTSIGGQRIKIPGMPPGGSRYNNKGNFKFSDKLNLKKIKPNAAKSCQAGQIKLKPSAYPNNKGNFQHASPAPAKS